MARININRAPEYLLGEPGLYTQAQLEVEPIHAPLLEQWNAEQAALESTLREYDAAKRAVVVAKAHRKRHQHKVWIAARSLANDLIELNGGNRKSDAYLGYFEDGYGIFGRLTLADQLDRARTILVRLDTERDEGTKAAGERFRAVAEIAETVEDDWKAKNREAEDFRAILHTAKIRWRTAYRKLEADLRSLHPDDPKFVASFFLASPSRKSVGDEAGGSDLEAVNSDGNSDGSPDGDQGMESGDAEDADFAA